jgi:hypothetical protein
MIFATMINVACSVYGSTKNEFYSSRDDALCGVLMTGFGGIGLIFFGMYILHSSSALGLLQLICKYLSFHTSTAALISQLDCVYDDL